MKMELLVRTRKRLDVSTQRWMSSAAPGIGWFSWTSTPSMSVSQHSMSWPLRYTEEVDRTSSASGRWSCPVVFVTDPPWCPPPIVCRNRSQSNVES